MITYTTIQGDTWDGIAYRLYEDEGYMKELLEANPDHVDILVFPAGVTLLCPDLEYEVDNGAPFWREDDAAEIPDEEDGDG